MSQKNTTKQSTAPPAEVIPFAALKAQHDAKRADVFCSVAVLSCKIGGNLQTGDVALCELKAGGVCFTSITKVNPDGSYAVAGDQRLMTGVLGRVVSVIIEDWGGESYA